MQGVLLAVCLCSLINGSHTARIMAITGFPLHSHQIPYQEFWKALVARGHELLLINVHPIRNFTRPNFRQISIPDLPELAKDFVTLSSVPLISFLEDAHTVATVAAEAMLKHPSVQKLYLDPEQRFDVVIVECLYMPAVFGLAYRFNAPTIGILSMSLPGYGEYLIGDPVLPSYPSSWETGHETGLNLGFFGRLKNFVRFWFHYYTAIRNLMADQQRVVERYLGPGIPSIGHLQKNVSVIFMNEDPAISFARPRSPKIVGYTGFHFPQSPAPLPKSIEEFLGDGTEGFVYFSLGTIAKSAHMPAKSRAIFHEVFSNLPCKVLWKYETELPWRSNNIYVAKRFPQYSVLAHPKIKLFIYHGGLQSSQEAIYYGVPLIGLPIFGDQHQQVNRLVSLGVARRLDIHNLTSQSLQQEIYEVLGNDSYKRRIRELRSLLNDKPQTSLEKLIWWTEFVIRRKGAPHLHSSIADQAWYQRYDTDVIGFLSILAFTGFFYVLLLLRKLIAILFTFRMTVLPDRTKKTL